MATKNVKEAEDNSLGAFVYQGKPLSEWEKLLKKEYGFTLNQVFALARSGADLDKILHVGLDEADGFDSPVFKDEEFFFNEKEKVDEVTDEEAALSEAARQPEDVVTVEDFIELLRRNAKLDDKLMFRVNKASAMLFNVNSRAGTAVVDIIPAKDSRRLDEDIVLDLNGMIDDFLTMGDLVRLGKKAWPHNSTGWMIDNIAAVVDGKVIDFKDAKYARTENYLSNGTFFLLDGKPASYDAAKTEIDTMLSENSGDKKKDVVNEAITHEQWQEAAEWFDNNGYDLEDDEVRQEQFAPQGDQFLFKSGKSPTGKDEVVNGIQAFELYIQLKDGEKMKATNEGQSWRRGGYGGTGRSWKSLNGKGPKGKAIGWYAVEELDPKAKGKMPGWRCGPSNFPFEDLLYPDRKYKVGTMVMRNKYLKAGEMSGEKYIALTSYFDALKNNDQEAINLLKALNIPLNLTFGLNPNDDYSITYTTI